MLVPAPVHAADDSSASVEGLDEVENAYVGRMRGAYGAALAALDKLSGDIGGAAFGALFGAGTPSPTEMLNMVLACRAALAATVPAFKEAPPASMGSLGSTHAAIASRLEGAFSPMMGIMYEEGKERILQAGREWLGGAFGGLLGDAPPPGERRTSVEARLLSSVLGEITDLRGLLTAGQGALNARIQEIQEEQAAGEEFLNFLFDECFIATAAYGTRTAVEIDVLRNFRDDVLMQSPAGRDLVGFYYAATPPLADFIARHESLRTIVRECIVDPIVWATSRLQPFWLPG